jgi:hypothetical protein
MRSTRRNFLQLSAGATAAVSLGPLGLRSAAARDALTEAGQQARNPGVLAVEAKLIRARPVPLDKVRLLGGPLKQAQDVTAKYLLSLEPDRMLAYYRLRAGLAQKAAPYGGWDGAAHNLTGHIAGHHLSGVSLMFLATGDARFKARADYLVRELKEVQDKHGDGYLSALEIGREAFGALSKGDIRSAAFDLNGMWSPWYTLHKLFAGLRDAYRHAGNRTALDLSVKFAGWAEGILAPLDDAQIQRMLGTEFGGMGEVLSDLYADTGDRRWLNLSYKFEHRSFTDAMKRHQDNLNGRHGNCHIPKLIASAARYGYLGDPQDIVAASFFWDRVVQHHSYATGGHGLAEYFGPPDQLSARVDGRTCETCNVYNMLKLTRRLFSFRPDPLYADFHERALFNHILASIDPEDGRTSYMVPVGRGVIQEYQNMLTSFTCCVGSGMESHALHGDGLYYESSDTVWVNLFAPSTADCATAGISLEMQTDFPDGGTATLTVSARSPKALTLAVRRPSWAGDGFAIKVNGVAVELAPSAASGRGGTAGRTGGPGRGGDEAAPAASSYVEVKRTWKTGDVVELVLPKSLRLEPTPDNKRVAAIMWGPLVLAGDLGPPRQGGRGGGAAAPPTPIPMLVAAERAVSDWVTPAPTRPGDFRVTQVARVAAQPATPADVSLTPFYRTQRRTYSVYFDLFTPAEWDARVAELAAAAERARKLAAATLGVVQSGDAQQERDANYQSDPPDRTVQRTNNRGSRGGAGWFSIDLPVDANAAMAVLVTYLRPQGQAPPEADFQVLVDGTAIGHVEPDAKAEGFYDVQYAVPAALVRGKAKVTVRFQAAAAGRIAPVFGVRMIRADAIR